MVNTEVMDNNHFYLMEHSGSSSIEECLLKLSGLRPQPEVQLLNYYKEVPVFANAKIIKVAADVLICSTSLVQTRVIEFSGYSIIKGAPFQHHVHAKALYDTDNKNIILSNLNYVDVCSNSRTSVRVRMQVPPVIGLEAGSSKFNGRLLDLSLDGCAVNIADQKLLESFSFFYLTINMPLKFNQAPTITRIMAKLTKVYQHNRLIRGIFMFEHDKSSEDRIGMLIAQRQTEIIKELSS